MTQSPARPPHARGAVTMLAGLGLATLAMTTLASPAATRMYSAGWREIAAAACIAPLLLLLARAFDRRDPLVLPSRGWLAAALAAAAVILLSALQSPYRPQAFLWSAPLLSAIAVFLVVFDWLNIDPAQARARRHTLVRGFAGFLTLVALAGLALWARDLPTQLARGTVFAARNPFPLGHSNYTAGIGLLLLPGAAWLASREMGMARAGWIFAAVCALALIFTSGSRGGMLGLAVLALVSIPAAARVMRMRVRTLAAATILALIAVVAANPRLRALVSNPGALRGSDVQRAAMIEAGARMGADRPLLGWGAGATPLVYPRFRAALDGGPDTVLQVHSTPLEIFAEFGGAGLAVAALFLVLLARSPRGGARTAALGLSGYLVFILTDWQLDIPVFAFALAAAAAVIAPRNGRDTAADNKSIGIGSSLARGIGVGALAAFALVVALARRDPTPEMNVRALGIAGEPGRSVEAVRLLEESLALNPHQEIAHFNLGWLLLVSDPAKASAHFDAAARLVPNKGGVYFGLGLAALNQGDNAGAAKGFALEALNDPLFLTSPWWRTSELGAVRVRTGLEVERMAGEVAAMAGFAADVAAEAKYVAALPGWLAGLRPAMEMLRLSSAPERVDFFSRGSRVPAFNDAKATVYYRERLGYPVLMRNLDVPVPRDLFDVQENALASTEFRFLFAPRGWLPAPALLMLMSR